MPNSLQDWPVLKNTSSFFNIVPREITSNYVLFPFFSYPCYAMTYI